MDVEGLIALIIILIIVLPIPIMIVIYKIRARKMNWTREEKTEEKTREKKTFSSRWEKWKVDEEYDDDMEWIRDDLAGGGADIFR